MRICLPHVASTTSPLICLISSTRRASRRRRAWFWIRVAAPASSSACERAQTRSMTAREDGAIDDDGQQPVQLDALNDNDQQTEGVNHAGAGEWTRLQQPPVLLHRPRLHALPCARAPRGRIARVVVGGRCVVHKSLDCVPIRRELRVRPAPPGNGSSARRSGTRRSPDGWRTQAFDPRQPRGRARSQPERAIALRGPARRPGKQSAAAHAASAAAVGGAGGT